MRCSYGFLHLFNSRWENKCNLLYNTLLRHFSPTLLSNTSLQLSSPTQNTKTQPHHRKITTTEPQKITNAPPQKHKNTITQTQKTQPHHHKNNKLSLALFWHYVMFTPPSHCDSSKQPLRHVTTCCACHEIVKRRSTKCCASTRKRHGSIDTLPKYCAGQATRKRHPNACHKTPQGNSIYEEIQPQQVILSHFVSAAPRQDINPIPRARTNARPTVGKHSSTPLINWSFLELICDGEIILCQRWWKSTQLWVVDSTVPPTFKIPGAVCFCFLRKGSPKSRRL